MPDFGVIELLLTYNYRSNVKKLISPSSLIPWCWSNTIFFGFNLCCNLYCGYREIEGGGGGWCWQDRNGKGTGCILNESNQFVHVFLIHRCWWILIVKKRNIIFCKYLGWFRYMKVFYAANHCMFLFCHYNVWLKIVPFVKIFMEGLHWWMQICFSQKVCEFYLRSENEIQYANVVCTFTFLIHWLLGPKTAYQMENAIF